MNLSSLAWMFMKYLRLLLIVFHLMARSNAGCYTYCINFENHGSDIIHLFPFSLRIIISWIILLCRCTQNRVLFLSFGLGWFIHERLPSQISMLLSLPSSRLHLLSSSRSQIHESIPALNCVHSTLGIAWIWVSRDDLVPASCVFGVDDLLHAVYLFVRFVMLCMFKVFAVSVFSKN